ncbi:MAG TPA: cyanophycin synthetase, partial [Treponemataceae bacterium]|nr:cyanophycin synthetase [Treponemataceae bacterium]
GIRGTEFVIDNKKTFLILPGMYNFYNALAAISVAKYMGLDTAEIVLGIEKNKPLFGRSQIINGHCTIVQDCYNANFESMSEAIELCDKTDVKGKKIFILGDMLELGDNSSNVHRQVCERALQSSADYIVFVGKEICKAYKHSKKTTKRVYCIENISDESIQKSKGYLERVIAKDDFVLLKASRGIRLERFIPLLPCVCKENGGIDV